MNTQQELIQSIREAGSGAFGKLLWPSPHAATQAQKKDAGLRQRPGSGAYFCFYPVLLL